MIEISLKNSNKINKICNPLHLYFRIDYFCYCVTNADGKFISIGSHPQMHEYYFYQKLYKCSPFFRNHDYIDSGVYLYRECGDIKFQNSIDMISTNLDLEPIGGIVKKRKNHLVRFGYATSRKNKKLLQNNFINNIPILEKFNDFFLTEAAEIIQKSDGNYLDLPKEIGKDFYFPPKEYVRNLNSEKKCKFLDSLNLINYKYLLQLSKREIDCLKLVKDGYTAKNIASELRISKRTVESYLQSIKNKLSKETKSELFEISRLLETTNFFNDN